MSETQNKQQETKANHTHATNEYDVQVTKVKVDVTKLQVELEKTKAANELHLKQYQAELEDKTRRFEILTNAIQSGATGAMVLTGFVVSQYYKSDYRKTQLELGNE